jgi:8-oxo-dGTP pyrophosphatase MutT (NUDIX family)
VTVDHAAGGVVFHHDGQEYHILMILDKYGYWTLPKGHLEIGENDRQAALREIYEETGVRGSIRADLGEIYYHVQAGQVRKRVHFFLVAAGQTDLKRQIGEIQDLGWVRVAEAPSRLGYENLRPVLMRGLKMLCE